MYRLFPQHFHFNFNFNSGWDLGASLFVIVDGNPVIDVAGGFKDQEKTAIYDSSTINLVFSSGKIMEALSIALLEDKGLLNIEEPVAKYWPEYGQNGKSEITIKDILTHRSGSSFSFDKTPSLDVLQSLDKRDEFVASQSYLYPRGTVSYRMLASAFICDAVCRRVDPKKRTLATFISEELFENKLGGEEVFISPPIIGKKDSKGQLYETKFSKVHDISTSTMLLGLLPQVFLPNIYSKILPNGHYLKIDANEASFFKSFLLKQKHKDGFSFFDQPTIPDFDSGAASYNNHSSYLTYEMMSANSISNAKALAKAFDAFMNSNGDRDGDDVVVREKTLTKFLTPLPEAYDRLLMKNFTHATGGWTITPNEIVPSPQAECHGWFGAGGSMLLHCKIGDHNVTFSYVMNAMAPTFRVDRGMVLLNELTALLQ